MDEKPEAIQDKKILGKAKSYNNAPPIKVRDQVGTKRKSFSLNEAVMSLDLALGRLKKSKLVAGESGSPPPAPRPLGHPSDMFMDLSSASGVTSPSFPNASLMSMNFSHYELMRNLSRSASTSEAALSGTTCNTRCADTAHRDEHLEKYFRSAEMWNCKHRDTAAVQPSVHFSLPDK